MFSEIKQHKQLIIPSGELDLINRFRSAYDILINKFYNNFDKLERNLFENFEELFMDQNLTNQNFILKPYNNTLTLQFNIEDGEYEPCWSVSIEFLISMFYIYIKLKNPQLKTCNVTCIGFEKNDKHFLHTYKLNLDTLEFDWYPFNAKDLLEQSSSTNDIYSFLLPSLYIMDVKNQLFSEEVKITNDSLLEEFELLHDSLKTIFYDAFSFKEKECFEEFKDLFSSRNPQNLNSLNFKLFITTIIAMNNGTEQNKRYNITLQFNNEHIEENFSLEFAICFIILCLKTIHKTEQQLETCFYLNIRTRNVDQNVENIFQVYKLDINNFIITQTNDYDAKYYFSLPCVIVKDFYNENTIEDFEFSSDESDLLQHDETSNYLEIIEETFLLKKQSQFYQELLDIHFNWLNIEEESLFIKLIEDLYYNLFANDQKPNIKFYITSTKAEITLQLEKQIISNNLMELICKTLFYLLFSSFQDELCLISNESSEPRLLVIENNQEIVVLPDLSKPKLMIYVSTNNQDELVPNVFSLDLQTYIMKNQSHYYKNQEQQKNYQDRKKFVSFVFENISVLE